MMFFIKQLVMFFIKKPGLIIMAIIIIVYLLIFSFVLGVGMGIGWLLSWLFPEINFGVAILIGIVSNAITLYFYFGISNNLIEYPVEDDFLEDEEPEEEKRSKIIPLRPIPTKRKKRKSR
jgi:hypothetical protein